MDALTDPKRDISLASTRNLRDLGGYTGVRGRKTRWGAFFRSGDMSTMSKEDQEKLMSMDVNSVVDLRMAKEIEVAPNVFSGSEQVFFVNHDFWGTRFDDYRSIRKTARPEEKLADLYCSGLEVSGFIMAAVIKTFAHQEGGFIFHCKSGKDRTGLVAAILLTIAEIPAELVCADFALTSKYLGDPQLSEEDKKKPGAYQKGSDPKTMGLTLEFLDIKYGGVEAYLKKHGVTDDEINSIRDKILDD
jgi:protein-tyrosine phosphatase